MSLRHFTAQSSQSYVRSFSILEEPHTIFNKRIIMPDSYPAVLINFGAPFTLEMENGAQVELPRVFLVGVQTKPLKIRATGDCQSITISLSAWGTRFLVGEQVDLAATPIVALDGIWRDLTGLLNKIFQQQGDSETLATLAQVMSDLERRRSIDVTSMRVAMELLYKTNGQATVPELAAECYLSSSQLERRSKYFTGLSPKTLARLIRFDATCSGLLDNSAQRLTDLAQKLGYADQAHFIHEFKSFADCTPRAAKIYIQQLAADAEFIQFS